MGAQAPRCSVLLAREDCRSGTLLQLWAKLKGLVAHPRLGSDGCSAQDLYPETPKNMTC